MPGPLSRINPSRIMQNHTVFNPYPKALGAMKMRGVQNITSEENCVEIHFKTVHIIWDII